jgi:hypothetical protein
VSLVYAGFRLLLPSNSERNSVLLVSHETSLNFQETMGVNESTYLRARREFLCGTLPPCEYSEDPGTLGIPVTLSTLDGNCGATCYGMPVLRPPSAAGKGEM